MASTTEQQFTALMRSARFKDHLFPHLSTSDLCAMRSVSSAFCNLVTKDLFTRIHVSFSATTFTKQPRLDALSRVGHHVEHLTFHLPHTEATFLPPLIHPESGKEISFLYSPHTSMGSVLTRRKYANPELGDILTQQYPPMFHAATNVPSFIAAFKCLPNLRHVTVRCPGQHPSERYRRDSVDYALISLRIAMERAPLEKLVKLSLSDIHPAAFLYLRHVAGFGCVPSAARRWRQIRKLHVSVEAWDFQGPSPGPDHLKVMDEYIRNLSPHLEKLSFTWLSRKGPCPLSLAADPMFAPSQASRKLFHEVTSPMSPLPSTPPRAPMNFPKLRYLQLRNVSMNAPQLKDVIASHKDTVKEFDLESVALANTRDWDEALSPLDRDEAWWRSSLTASSEYSLVTNDSDDDIYTPSAAVEAASRELLDVELAGASVILDDLRAAEDGDEDLSTVAKNEKTMSFTTNLKRRRVRRRRRRHHSGDQDEQDASSRRFCDDPRPMTPSPLRTKKSPHKASSSSPIRSDPRPTTPPSPLQCAVSAPMLNPEPHPVLLQPTVYDASTRHRAAPPHEDISAVQRNIEQEEAHRRLAEDTDARVSALRKAKAAVLNKLSREYGGTGNTSCGSSTRSSGRSGSTRHGSRRGHQGGGGGGGQSVASNSGFAGRTADAVAACRLMASRDFGRCAGIDVVEDRRTLESRSVLVPLMFSRA
ncbi:hypothetical protein GMORB2_0964 [Geosmithia morbida]|uniref:F-box domain-containing protein n=1 Tax=Geosmithia morbida TaxID=1094350 RepID=A0A9P5D7E7_9HYPO|nr:uncharacterized protein GMORB2_0964 [Geosmithia morbida]KAF4125720.1 hypothetical protein GMORB2_0964 [Geosmithia morbida]